MDIARHSRLKIFRFCAYLLPIMWLWQNYIPISHSRPAYKGKQTHSQARFRLPLFWQVFPQAEFVVPIVVAAVPNVVTTPTAPLALHLNIFEFYSN